MPNGMDHKPPRILVLSASVGAGHLRAAEAVELALRETAPDAFVRNLDVLETTNRTFRRLYGRSYLGLMNRAPYVHGYFYDLFDRPGRAPVTRTDRLRLALERLNLRRFVRFLQAEPWDLIVNTHFLPAEIVASLRRRGKLDVPQVIVTTDFDTHRMWVHSPCEHYFTATEEGSRYLQFCGVPAADVSVTGVPIHPVFRTPKDRTACAAKHGLATDRPVVLQMAGGFGVVGPIQPMYEALLRTARPIELVTAVGRNAALQARLEKVADAAAPPRPRAAVHPRHRRVHGRGRPGGVQAGRPDRGGDAGARGGAGDGAAGAGAGEPQQRLPAGERGGGQGEQPGAAGVQGGRAPGRPGSAGPAAPTAPASPGPTRPSTWRPGRCGSPETRNDE